MTTPVFRAGAAAAALTVLALGIAGCTVRTLERDAHYVDEDFAFTELADANVAVGGVVMAADIPVDGCADLPDTDFAGNHLAQADRWSYALYSELTSAGAGREVWGWPAVRSLLGEEERTRLLDSYARDGHLDPDILSILNESLPGVDYLCLARVGDTQLERLVQFPGTVVTIRLADPAAAWDRIDLEPGDPIAAAATDYEKSRQYGVLGRTIWMTLDFYDLKAGYSVATVKACINLDTTWWMEEPQSQQARSLVYEENTEPVIKAAGSTRYAPPLGDTISACIGSLVTVLER